MYLDEIVHNSVHLFENNQSLNELFQVYTSTLFISLVNRVYKIKTKIQRQIINYLCLLQRDESVLHSSYVLSKS